MTLPTVDFVEIGATKIITNWPAEMIDYYDAHNLMVDSPVIRRMLRSTSPFNYDVEAINTNRGGGKKSTVIELFNRYGMEAASATCSSSPLCEAQASANSLSPKP